jgi:hypothetical protein
VGRTHPAEDDACTTVACPARTTQPGRWHAWDQLDRFRQAVVEFLRRAQPVQAWLDTNVGRSEPEDGGGH